MLSLGVKPKVREIYDICAICEICGFMLILESQSS